MASRKTASQATPKRLTAQRRTRQSGQSPASGRRLRRARSPTRPKRLLIVGIGASAGGLEALEEFFWHMPADSGLAFVVVTHQSLHSPSLLPDILGRSTAMRVVQATDGMRVEPNGVYIAPPDGHLTIQCAVLHRLEATRATDVYLPIDTLNLENEETPRHRGPHCSD